jgi:hypothetical protein
MKLRWRAYVRAMLTVFDARFDYPNIPGWPLSSDFGLRFGFQWA